MSSSRAHLGLRGFAVAASALALLAACDTARARPEPRLVRVVPDEVVQAEASELRVEGEGLVAEVRDAFRSEAAPSLDVGFRAWVGEVELPPGAVTQLDAGALRLALPAGALPLGLHALRVRTPGGREAVREGALRVVPVAGARALAFVTPERAVAPGACSAALTLELRGPDGAPLPAPEGGVALTLAADGTGVGFYDGPDCARAVTGLQVPAGATQAGFHARADAEGVHTLRALAPGGAEAAQTLTVTAGAIAAQGFRWAPVGPQRAGVAFAVSLEALDASGQPAARTGPVLLSLVGTGTLACVEGCTDARTTAPLVDGRWAGRVVLTGVAGGTRALVAAQGPAAGASAPFSIVPVRSAPRVVLRALTGVVRDGQAMSWEAVGEDHQTAESLLEYSFDLEGNAAGAPGLAPWTAWSRTARYPATYRSQGYRVARVAVRDADGEVGYGAAVVLVLRTQDTPCVVDHADVAADDGATGCDRATQAGPDGRLSLAEAMRVAPGGITFAPGLALTGAAAFSVARELWLVGDGRVRLPAGVTFSAASGATLVLSGLELAGGGAAPPVVVRAGGFAVLENVRAAGAPPVRAEGALWLYRTQLTGCAGACVEVDGAGAELVARATRLADAPLGLDVRACAAGSVDVAGTVLQRLGTGARLGAGCAGARLLNVTLAGNGTALALADGAALTLQNAALVDNATAAACTTGTLPPAGALLLWGNTQDGCAAGVPGPVRADPLFAVPEWGDLRPTAGSPALDAGEDTGVDVNDAAPGNFDGAAPDLGGAEGG